MAAPSLDQYLGKMAGVGKRSSRLLLSYSFAGDLRLWPAFRADADDSPGTDAFDDEVGLKLDLNATASKGDFSARSGDRDNFATGGDVTRAVVAGGVLQGAPRSVDLRLNVVF